jgi:hypothetical protein
VAAEASATRLIRSVGRRVMAKDRDELFRSALQVVAVLYLVALLAMILHKAIADVSRLAQQHSGADFWAALARQMLRNLAGG